MDEKHLGFDKNLLKKYLSEETLYTITEELRGYDELSIKERYVYCEIYNYRFHESLEALCKAFDVSRSGYCY